MAEEKNEQQTQEEEKSIFTMIPLSISSLEAKDFSMTEKVLLCSIIGLSNGRLCTTTNDKFALRFGISTRQVTEHIRKLSEKGMILIMGPRTRRYIKPTEKALELFRKKVSIEETRYRRNLLKKKTSRTMEENLPNYGRNLLPENKENKREEIYSSNSHLNQSAPSNSEKDESTKDKEQEYEDMFSQFWEAYPRKQKKKEAHDKFIKKIKKQPALFPKIMKALEQQKNGRQWQKDGGQFIPLPTTWINGEQWNDEIEVQPPASPSSRSSWGGRSAAGEISEAEQRARDEAARRAAGFED